MDRITVFRQLASGGLMLTPNQRIGAYWSHAYGRWQHEQGQRLWPCPNILPWQAWIEQRWRELGYHQHLPACLSPLAQRWHWRQIIECQTQDLPLINLNSTINSALSAWQLLNSWEVDISQPQTPDQETFAHWVNLYRDLLDNNHWCDPDTRPGYLFKLNDTAQWPSPIILTAFTELTPSQQALLSQASEVITWQPGDPAESIHQATLANPEQELKAVLAYAAQQKQQSIAIVLPDLNIRLNEVKRFCREWDPDNQLFDISLGQPLSSYPLCQTVLDSLKHCDTQLNRQQVVTWLRSPFLGQAETALVERANWAAELLAYPPTLSRQKILRIGQAYCPDFCAHWAEIKPPKQQTLNQWLDWLVEMLNKLGWPGERSLDSHEYQTVQRLEQLCRDLKQQANNFPILSLTNFRQLLQQSFEQTIFQPEQPTPQIKILGLLEAPGLAFDQVILTGCDSRFWPAPANPNPFIPLDQQRRQGLPRASSTREYLYSQALWQQYQTTAPKILLTRPGQIADQTVIPSGIFADYDPINLTVPTTLEIKIPLEPRPDTNAPPLSEFSGGAYVLSEQATCPYQAFARRRLQATPLPSYTYGVDAMTKGQLIHQILEKFWSEVPDKQTLLTLPDLESKIKAIAESICRKTLREPELSLEIQRTTQRVLAALALDYEREEFKIHQLETDTHLTLNGQRIKLRPDRIDINSNNELHIIDYKTGSPNPCECFGERPTQIQLPLYALANPSATQLSFLQIQAQAIEYKTINLTSEDREAWTSTCQKLLNAYMQGMNTPDPKYGPQTCQTCECYSLCRISEVIHDQ